MSDKADRTNDLPKKDPLDGFDATIDQPKREADDDKDVPETVDQQTLDATRGAAKKADLSNIPEIPGHEVLGFLAKGGMGLVLKAKHRVLERIVAIKLPLAADTTDSEFQTRFLREARAAAKLKHPQICPIYEVGEVENRPYIVLEFIPGETLGEWLREESPTARDSAEMVGQLAEAVQFAHDKGVLHRDIKPANVVIHAETRLPVLMDFGLAKETADQESHLTQDGQIMGTPVYMAPEQAAGKIDELGPTADVYSLGAVLYHLICRRAPFQGTVGEVLTKVQTEEPPTPRSLNPKLHRDLETICLKAMAKPAADRYPSAGALASDLARFSAGDAILARPPGPIRRLSRSIQRNPTVWSAVAGGLLLVAISIMLVMWSKDAAQRASVDRRIGELENALDQGSRDATEWTEIRLTELDEQLQELEGLDAARARGWRDQVNQRMAKSIETSIRAPSLSEADAERIMSAIERLENRQPGGDVDEIRAQLQGRVARWQDLILAEAPLASKPTWLPDSLHVQDGSLVIPRTAELAKKIRLATPSSGRIEFEVQFATQWTTARRLGLGFNDHREQGYRVMFAARRSTPDASASAMPLAAAMAQRRLELILMRNGSPVKRWPLEDLTKSEPLTIRTRREGNRLDVWVNEKQHFQYADIFPIASRDPGVFVMFVPPSTPITRIRAAQRILPLTPSPLETADALYDRGEFQAALNSYMSVDAGSAESDVRQELLVKRALCHLELEQGQQAEELLSRAMNGKKGRWASLASARLWAHYLTGGKNAEADSMLDLLATQYQFGELGAALPTNLQRQILARYANSVSSLDSLLRFDADRLRDVERLASVRELLGEAVNSNTSLLLIHAYRLNDQLAKASEVAKREAERASPGFVIEYCDTLCQKGDLDFAATELARLKKLCNAPDFSGWPLAESRIAGAQGKWGHVLEVTDGMSQWPDDEVLFRSRWYAYMRGMLIRGIAHHRMGDPQLAKSTWRDAVSAIRKVQATLPKHQKTVTQNEFYLFVLYGLAGEFTEVELNALVRNFVKDNGFIQIARFVADYQEIAETVNRVWSTPRGLELAEAIGVDRLSVRDRILQPATLMMYGYVRPRVFGDASLNQEQLLWDVCEDSLRGLLITNDLQTAQLMLLAAAFKGQEGFTGWGAVANGLSKERRARYAYLLGHRYLKMKRPESAAKRLEEALQVVEDDATVSQLAQASKDLLSSGRGEVVIRNPSTEPANITLTNDGKKQVVPVNGEARIDLPAGNYQVHVESSDKQLNSPTKTLVVSLMGSKTLELQEPAWRGVTRHFLAKGFRVNLQAADESIVVLNPKDALPLDRRRIVQISSTLPEVTDADLAVMRSVDTLRQAYLGYLPLTSPGGIRLFGHQPHMRTLIIGSKPFDHPFAQFLNKRRIPVVGFSSSTGSGIAALAPSAPLHSLQLPTALCTPEMATRLKAYSGLKVLWVYGPTIDRSFLAALRELKNLQTIGLGITTLTPEMLAELPEGLTAVVINNDTNRLTDRHILALQHLKNLRLSMAQGDLGATALEALRSAVEPRVLLLTSGKFSREQAEKLGRLRNDRCVMWRGKLAGAPTADRQIAVEILREEGSRLNGFIDDVGGGATIARDMINEQTSVSIRSIHFHPDCDLKMVDRAASSPAIDYVRLVGKAITNDHLMKLKDATIEGLSIRETPLDDSAVDILLKFRRLNQLDLRATKISSAGILRLLKPQKLGHLLLTGDQLTKEIAAALRQQANPLSLDIQEVRNEHIEMLSDARNLDVLSLVGSRVEPAVLAKIPSNVRRLRFGWSRELTADHVNSLAHLSSFDLELQATPVSADLLPKLAEIKSLRRLRLADIEVNVDQLQKLRNIRKDLLIHVQE